MAKLRLQVVLVWILFWHLSECNDAWNWAFVARGVCIYVLAWSMFLAAFIVADIVIWRNQWLLLFVCHPGAHTFIQKRKAWHHSGEGWKWERLTERFTLTVTSYPLGEIEEQRAVRYLKFLHSESTGWRASEIYNRTLSSFPSGYKPLRCFCFYYSFFLPFNHFFHFLCSHMYCDVKILALSKLMN